MVTLTGITLAACSSTWSYVPENPTEGYQAYTATGVAAALNDGDTVVLYFWATRCPSCVAMMKDIEASADEIPENVTIFAVDFDEASELKKEYGVTDKHTTVYLNSDGEAVLNNTNKEYSLADILAWVEAL